MPKLEKLIIEQLTGLPRQFLREKLKIKLQDQGIEAEDLLNRLTDHILSGSDQSFFWGTGKELSTKDLSIAFTEEDGDQIISSLNHFLGNEFPTFIQDTMQASAKSLVRQLERNWPEQNVHERNDLRSFRDRLAFRWSKGLDPLRMLLAASREVGQEFADKLARSKAKRGIAERHAILILHMRACQTSLEILTLLENGLADGAYARWRTLYEITVVAFVIERFGDEIAERYFAHDAVSMREAAVNEFRHENREYVPDVLKGELRELEDEFQSAVQRYGKSFASPYGWASHHLGIKAPSFSDLERAVDWGAVPPNYKWSSYKVHAGVAGAIRGLGSVGGLPLVHSGASNVGLDVPAINTAYSLLQVTTLVFKKPNELETSIQMQALVLLREKITKECTKIAKKLEKEELEIRFAAG